MDDAAAILVNGQMVSGTLYGAEGDWIEITDRLLKGQESRLLFASWNHKGRGSWGFSLRNDDEVKWNRDGQGEDQELLQFVTGVVIWPDGQIEEVGPDPWPRFPPPGRWYVLAQDVRGIGVMTVNGWPVGGAFTGTEGDWIEITSYLDSAQDNNVVVQNWHCGDRSQYHFAIRRDQTIVWEKEGEASERPGAGLAFSETVSISPQGLIRQQRSAPTWSVKAYNVDDAAAILVNEEVVGGVLHNMDGGWVDITERVTKVGDTEVLFVSWNHDGPGRWGFSLRNGDTILYRIEAEGQSTRTIQLAKKLEIGDDGQVIEVLADPLPRSHPAGQWYVRAHNLRDIGGILINGWPVGEEFQGSSDWIDIASYLDARRDNQLRMYVWNVEGKFSFDFALRRDENILWSFEHSGSGVLGEVFDYSLIITPDGDVQQ